jgi:hypothetical protein
MSRDKFGNAHRGSWWVWDLTPEGGGPPVNIRFDDALSAREAVANDPARYAYEPSGTHVFIWDLWPEGGGPPCQIKLPADMAKDFVENDPTYYSYKPKR